VLGNDSTLPTAHYTVGPEGNSIKNIGKKGPDRARTAQNTHFGRLGRRKQTLPKHLILDEKDALFRVIDDPRDRAIFSKGRPDDGRHSFSPDGSVAFPRVSVASFRYLRQSGTRSTQGSRLLD
jgi:hypothetical protein